MKSFRKSLMLGVQVSSLAMAGVVHAQEAPGDEAAAPEIVVTAQKRAQSQNDVGMSITAESAATLAERNVVDAGDLVKIVSGFTAADSNQGTPVYTLRGVGLNDSGLSSVPSVAIYVDQIPLPYPVMTQAVGLDLERVEVLKGPQGTLFGQNSTGGAINYIAAKPTAGFSYGLGATVDSFGRTDASGFVSGPLSDTVRARLALRSVQGGAWQRHSTTGQKLGDERKLQGRLSVDVDASDRLDLHFTATAWQDKSDTQAGQLTAIWAGGPSNSGIPGLIGGAGSPLFSQPVDGLKKDARAAAWNTDWPMRNDSKFWQIALAANYDLGNDLTLTSLTSYSDLKYSSYQDTDSTALSLLELRPFGTIKYFSQELRLAYDAGKVHALIGANYDHSDVTDRIDYRFEGASIAYVPFLPLRLSAVQSSADQTHKTLAAFGHLEYAVTDNLTAIGGIRYTNAKVNGAVCTRDTSANQAATTLLSFASGYTIPPRGCYLINDITGAAPGSRNVSLDENSTSFNVGLNYKLANRGLLYASFSRGYKGGVIPNISGTLQSQLDPAKQERLDAYEGGFKLPLFGRALQVNGAVFHYSYKDKQVRGRIFVPFFNLLEKLINVPSSRIFGQELSINARPVTGLTLSGSVTHLDSEIDKSFLTYNGSQLYGDIKGSRLPFTPEWSGNADAQYKWGISNSVDAYLGASVTFASKSNTTFQTATLPASQFDIPARALLDLRAGVTGADGTWTVEAFGTNVTDKYYYDTTYFSLDTITRSAGRPATWGLRVTLRN